MQKVIKSILVAGLSITAGNALALNGLTLCQTGYDANPITVTCNGKNTGIPIPGSTGEKKCAAFMGITDLPWAALVQKALSGKHTGTCVFTDSKTGKTLGADTVTINNSSSQGMLGTVVNPATDANIEVSHDGTIGVGVYANNYAVSITPKKPS